jgi:molybdate transport system substrate-binding protein
MEMSSFWKARRPSELGRLWRALWPGVVLGFALGAGCAAPPPATLQIAAAADLRYALEEIVAAFEAARPGARVSVSFGSSGNFFAQLVNGAPFDLFLSADVAYARQLAERGLTLPGSQFSYADGRVVVWAQAGSPLPLDAAGIRIVSEPAVRRIAIANPQHAPYGRAAEAAMQAAGVLETARAKLVLGENISQTLQFVQSGAADVGIVALSLALAPTVRAQGKYWLIPAEMHARIEQGGVVMKRAAHPETALAFRDFMLDQAGRAVLRNYGFAVPGE